MLRINALKLNIITDKGKYGTPVIEFGDGLTILKGFNSTGKSTIFQSILYCLGLEELLGGKNEKTMQSVLKAEILNDEKQKEAIVIESNIILEITGAKSYSIKRYIGSDVKNSGLVEVFDGNLLTGKGLDLEYKPMYVHDKGSADIENAFGFHGFLEKIIGWELPKVRYKNGDERKLYVQNIFPGLIIEQKAGWTDFLSTIPYYALNDKETRAVEFLLNLDSWEIRRNKSLIRQEKDALSNDWKSVLNDFKTLARQLACETRGIEKEPHYLESKDSMFLSFLTESNEYISAESYTEILSNEFQQIDLLTIPTVGEKSEENETLVNVLNEELSNFSINLDNLINSRNILIQKQSSYQSQLVELEKDKVQNEYHLKVKKKGAESGFDIAHDTCPYCDQNIKDSLLPRDIDTIPMQIEDNIEYLKAQIKLIKAYINNHKDDVENLGIEIEKLRERIKEKRQQIRQLRAQLISDERLPSIADIQKKLKLESKLTLYKNGLEKLSLIQERFYNISVEWMKLLVRDKKLPKSLSNSDYQKLKSLQNTFKNYLSKFNYRSKTIDDISISMETFLPVVEGYSMRFDSSASDFIRAIWSFTLAIKETSEKLDGNHPNLIIIDEPSTQDTGDQSLHTLLKTLGNYKNTQSIVFSSFHESDETFNACTQGIDFKLVDLGKGKFIKSIDQ